MVGLYVFAFNVCARVYMLASVQYCSHIAFKKRARHDTCEDAYTSEHERKMYGKPRARSTRLAFEFRASLYWSACVRASKRVERKSWRARTAVTFLREISEPLLGSAGL